VSAAANKAAEEGELKHLRSAIESMPQRTVQGCEYVHLDSVLAEICQLEIIAADRAARAGASEDGMDAGFLQWIHDRMRFVHGENENYDYMHKLRAIIASVPSGRDTPNLASIAAPSAPVGAAPSIDTPKFQYLIGELDSDEAERKLIAHIDQHVASQVRAARDAALDDAAELAMGCDKRATSRGIAIAIKQLKAPAISHSGEG